MLIGSATVALYIGSVVVVWCIILGVSSVVVDKCIVFRVGSVRVALLIVLSVGCSLWLEVTLHDFNLTVV